MEQLIQKYVRCFYAALIIGILVQLVDVVLTTLKGTILPETFILMVLSITNVILLYNSIKNNVKQRFTECKESAKILRFTLPLLTTFQALICFTNHYDLIALCNHLIIVVITVIVLSYRIKSIEYLENLANRFAKDNALDQKGE